MFKHVLLLLIGLSGLLPLFAINSLEHLQAFKTYRIDSYIDLGGKIVNMPEGCTLCFGRHGKVYNGTIIGKETRIKKARLDCVGAQLSGTWKLRKIYDCWFDQDYLSDNQIMDNLMALQRNDIKQKLVIERNYLVELDDKRSSALSLYSNTDLKLNSTIAIKGNNLPRYNIVSIENRNNVKITGGILKGDVGAHQYIEGSTSEWGFALFISASKYVVVTDLKATLCTGDGVYISGGEEKGIGEYATASENIVLKRCVMDNLRREGVSLVHANGVLIEDCKAINMGQAEYTPPSFGIDIEPNKNKAVKNVIIRRFVTENTKAEYSFATSGYQFDGVKYNRQNVVLEDCIFDKGLAIMSGGVKIKNSTMKKVAIYTSNVPQGEDGQIIFDNCTIEGGNGIQFDGRKKMKSDMPEPSYSFNSCTISADQVYEPIPGLIWGTDLDNVHARVIFHNSKISLKPSLKNNNLITRGFGLDCKFEGCQIEMGDYVLEPRGLKFNRCTIECKDVNGSSDNENGFVKTRVTKTVQ